MGEAHQVGQATPEDIRLGNKRCWGCQKQKFIIFTDWTGWRFCFKCWRKDYKWGREQGLWKALKEVRIEFIK